MGLLKFYSVSKPTIIRPCFFRIGPTACIANGDETTASRDLFGSIEGAAWRY